MSAVESVLVQAEDPSSKSTPDESLPPTYVHNVESLPENPEEPHVEFLPDEYSSGGEDTAEKPIGEARKRRKRGARLRYTEDEITKMRDHLKEQMEMNPRPSLLEVWTAYAVKYPGRTPSALMQEHGRHPELFGPRSLDHPPSIKPKSKPAAPLSESPYPYPYPSWTEEDTQVLLDFLRQRNQDAATDWDALKSKSQRRPPQSFRIKYSKNRDLFDAMARGTNVSTSTDALEESADIADRPAFTWQLPTGALKRPRSSEDLKPNVPRQRRASTSLAKRYVDESSDERDSGDDYHSSRARLVGPPRLSRRPRQRKSEGDTIGLSIRVPVSTTPGPETSHLPTPRHSVPITPGGLPSLPAWLPEFSPVDKAAALKWVVTRTRPTGFLQNIESWLQFADNHPEHSPPEWLCYYLVHHPTFDAVESGLGSPIL